MHTCTPVGSCGAALASAPRVGALPQVAGSLAAELASNAGSSDEDSTYSKLERW